MRSKGAASGLLAMLAIAASSCTTQVGRTDGFGGAEGVDDAGVDATEGAGDDSSADDDEGVATTDDATGGTAIRCDKIDVLFVTETAVADPAGNQEHGYSGYEYALQEGLATLLSELYVSVGVDDVRVMLTGSMQPKLEPSCIDGECTDVIVDDCDLVLGAGRNGFEYVVEVPYENEWQPPEECMTGRWVESGTPDLVATFSCLFYYFYLSIEGGSGGGGDRPIGGSGPDTAMDAMLAAVGAQNEATGCNAGFVRDDALLVVVVLAPAEDDLPDTSSGSTATWHTALAEVKGGKDGNVVVLALTGDGDLEQPLCATTPVGPLPAGLRELADSMPHGKWASSCIPTYEPFFSAAAEVVDAACEEFTPEG